MTPPSLKLRRERWFSDDGNLAHLNTILSNPVFQEAMFLTRMAGLPSLVRDGNYDGKTTLVHLATDQTKQQGWQDGLSHLEALANRPVKRPELPAPFSHYNEQQPEK